MSDGSHIHDPVDLTGYVTQAKLDAVQASVDLNLSVSRQIASTVDNLKARVTKLELDKWAISGFRLAFLDTFDDRTILRGHITDTVKGWYGGTIYADKYLWNTWKTNYGGGVYSASQVEIANGIMDILVETRAATFPDGIVRTGPVVAGFKPVADVSDLDRTGAITGPYIMEFRIRADSMPGYKGVPMLWTGRNWKTEPASGYTFTGPDDVKYPDGENDIIEGSFDKQPSVYIHHSWVKSSDLSSVQQAYFPTPIGTKWQDWHTYRIVFYPSGIAGATWTPKVEVWMDGNLLGRVTDKVPGNFPFRPNFQFEPNLTSTVPSATVKGHIQIDHIAIWVPTT